MQGGRHGSSLEVATAADHEHGITDTDFEVITTTAANRAMSLFGGEGVLNKVEEAERVGNDDVGSDGAEAFGDSAHWIMVIRSGEPRRVKPWTEKGEG